MAGAKKTFPGGSKKRVNRAGDAVRSRDAGYEDMAVIEEWRGAHRHVLNTFQAILRTRTRRTGVTVAQRHKRRRTIFDKLRRFPDMQLSRMDDVAGCRLIFRDIEHLNAFRQQFHNARFKHKRRNEADKYNYILNPKETGYRGIHDVYVYDVNSETGAHLAGLYVEIQYRTLIQHAWATAVEVIGFITQSQPKFQQGDKRYEQAMVYASEILARAHEALRGPLPHFSDREIVEGFVALDRELGLIQMLRGLHAARDVHSSKRNTILIFRGEQQLEVRSYRGATEAIQALFDLEKEMPDVDMVLVRADTSEEVRLAFRNYFSDASEFIRLIEDGCAALMA